MDSEDLRREYSMRTFDEKDADGSPFVQFDRWFGEAVKAGIVEPNAMALATVSEGGKPSCRMVLMKRFGHEGLDFFTNRLSRKGVEMEAVPYVAATFYWKELERQVTVEGKVIKLGEEESLDYFASRPRESRFSAWASKQGETVASREALEKAYRESEKKFKDKEIPLPPHWGGYRIIPDAFEFWQGRPNRLHDRLRYSLEGREWKVERLFP
jgi:pyridoxamine 5'-phosphate oxidase